MPSYFSLNALLILHQLTAMSFHPNGVPEFLQYVSNFLKVGRGKKNEGRYEKKYLDQQKKRRGAVAYQLGNTSSRTITEIKQC